MNHLDVIKNYVSALAIPSEYFQNTVITTFPLYRIFLQALDESNEWLSNKELTKEVISRLWIIKPESSEECLKIISIFEKIHYEITPLKEKNEFQELLVEMESNFINIYSTGAIHVEIKDTFQDKQWDCLERLKRFLPITDIKFSYPNRKGDLDRLISFFEKNPNIVSLNLDRTLNINDRYLEKISKNLPNIQKLTIQSNYITVIPAAICKQIIMLDCSNCYLIKTIDAINLKKINISWCLFLTNLNVPNATKLICNDCPALGTIEHSNLIKLECSSCENLTAVNVPNLLKLTCGDNKALTTIAAPKAIEINCTMCPILTNIEASEVIDFTCHSTALTNINVPKASKLECTNSPKLITITASNARYIWCDDCSSLKTITAPNLKQLICRNCSDLTSITAPLLRIISCDHCSNLASITTPGAISISCNDSSALTSITAPRATFISCNNCSQLTSISVPNAVKLKLFCKSCSELTSITAPKLIKLNLSSENCPSLKAEVKFNLFKLIFRNVLMESSNNFMLLLKLIDTSFLMYGLEDPKGFPSVKWFINAYLLNVPPVFKDRNEEELYKGIVNLVFLEFENLIREENNFKGLELERFLRLKKCNSLQQEMKRIIWLATVFEFNNEKKNLLMDKNTFLPLKAINEVIDPFMRNKTTKAFFSIYQNEDKHITWNLITQSNQKPHVILLSLFLCASDLDLKIIQFLMKRLTVNHYKNCKVLNPILELLQTLLENSSLDKENKEKILKLIFNTKLPQKKREESKEDFYIRKKEYQNNKVNQGKWVGACRDLLFFGKGEEFKNIDSIEKLLEVHQRFYREFFGVEEELAEEFFQTFKSKRYPNALFTYAARLQTLPEDQKTLLVGILGKFVNACLKKEFPNIRYDFSNNRHLKEIFQNDPVLLEKWKEPLKIPLMQVEKSDSTSKIAPHIIVKDLMKSAIENGHLVKDKNMLSKVFMGALESENFDAIQSTIQTIKSQSNQVLLDMELNLSQIEIDCLNIIDPLLSSNQRIEALTNLFEKLPDSLEFKNDIKGIITALKTPATIQSNFISIESAESWEDFLLMGTEVNNSCQRIQGNPNYNKCLLSYILDGKNKVIVVKNVEDKIVARTVLRILWDGEKNTPILFMEKIYTNGQCLEASNLIRKGCEAVAENMNLTLVASLRDFPENPTYQGVLSAIGGPVPYEYVDALSGIQDDGIFTIEECSILRSALKVSL